jgi:predicted DNA-binding transcriptional regulator YafY
VRYLSLAPPISRNVPVNFETVNWILSFGSNVVAVNPPELRETVKAGLVNALDQYR